MNQREEALGSPEVVLVDRWHHRLNDGDVKQLTTLIHPDVELAGPRGGERGAQAFAEWVSHARVRLAPVRYFARGDRVVAEEEAEWPAQESEAAVTGTKVATLFLVRDGRIVKIQRFETLDAALAAADLDRMADEVPQPEAG